MPSKQTVTIHPETNMFVSETLKRLSKILPYNPEFGGIDYSGSEEALVVNALVEHAGRFLALKRSSRNDMHVGEFNNVAGYMQGNGESGTETFDTITEELQSEAGIAITDADSVVIGSTLEVVLPNRLLHIVPALIRFSFLPAVSLNNEHTDFGWYTWEHYQTLAHVPVVDRVYEQLAS